MIQSVRRGNAGNGDSMTRVLLENADHRDLLRVASATSRSSHRQPPDLLGEGIFQKILCWERKRTERSGRCVLLMLLDLQRVVLKNPSHKVLSRIVSALCSPTRETDIAGWYQTNSVLAVMFTELQKTDRNSLQTLMNAEVIARLRANLGEEQADQISISFYFFPEDGDHRDGNSPIDETLYPDLRERNDASKLPGLAKRAIDILGSALAIIVFSPLFILIAAAVKLTSRGPVLFKQERVGGYGRRFTFLKFRSMKCVNDSSIHQDYIRRFIAGEIGKSHGGAFKIKNDPRLTRIGGFLRKSSLDELPQLINVLKGEMSLVGPRPAIPYEIDLYQAWHRGRFLEVKPGITGLWQVTGRSRTTFDEMVRLDLQYAKQWSLWLDIKILLQTPRAVLSREGAY
jgi:lipopolysaccharide/colanic/teichoic acid biosynthesis glycosyltransferase